MLFWLPRCAVDRSVRVWNFETKALEVCTYFPETEAPLCVRHPRSFPLPFAPVPALLLLSQLWRLTAWFLPWSGAQVALHPSGLHVLVGATDKLRCCFWSCSLFVLAAECSAHVRTVPHCWPLAVLRVYCVLCRFMNVLMDDLRVSREFPIKQCTEVNRGSIHGSSRLLQLTAFSFSCSWRPFVSAASAMADSTSRRFTRASFRSTQPIHARLVSSRTLFSFCPSVRVPSLTPARHSRWLCSCSKSA